MDCLVSVVMPSYNYAHFIGRALQSVLDQTYSNWEALVVDNHSQDNTDDIIKSFNDPRIRLLKIHNHGVIAASRNLGIREARGEWIAFLDSDDCWYPTKLEVIMAAVNTNNSYDVLCNDELLVDTHTGDKRVLRHGPYKEDFYRELLVGDNRLSPSATVISRNFLVRHGLAFNESQGYVTVEDYDLWLNLARCGACFKFIHDVQGEYVLHGTNSAARLSRHWENYETVLHDHVFNIQQFDPSPDRLWEKVSLRLRLGQVKRFVAQGQLGLALKLALKTTSFAPIGTATYLLSKIKRRLEIRRR
jgi:glycosyltransferase involved in cell wall biosynthesis